MSNRWSRKNPYLSAWLNGAGADAHTAPSHAGSKLQAQAAVATRQMAEVVMSAWLAPLARPTHVRGRR